jgi:hypothetical protein
MFQQFLNGGVTETQNNKCKVYKLSDLDADLKTFYVRVLARHK